ncbi:MAG: putative periplasmic protein [Actinomycetia bacterium]|nr:putative periplasmic protein [Actinomycetes bacterium]
MRLLSTAAGRGIAILFLGLLLAALLQAEGLRKQAQIQPAGFQRNLALRVTRPLVSVSRALHLTTPRHELQVAIGRADEDRIDTRVHLTLPPPAGPLPEQQPRTQTHASKPQFTRVKPLRIWVAGDSLAEVPGQALERITDPAVKIVGVESRLSTGLARTDLYNWFTRIQQVPGQLRPKVAVFSFGADDAHDYMGGAHVGPFGSPSWIAEYRRRVDGVTRELNAAGIYVVWLGLPIPDGPGFRKSFPIVNRILESVAKKHAKQSTFVDTWHLLDDFHARYAQYLRVHGKLTMMRLPDGVHYTAAAGDLIAQQVLKQLGAVYRLS